MSSPHQQIETLQERHQQAQALQNDGKPEAALAVYRTILETDDRDLPALHQVAQICASIGKFDDAIAASRKAIEVDENPPFWVYRHLGFSLSQKEYLDEAIEAYEQAIELNSEDAISYGLLGQVQEKQGNIDGSIASYQRASELSSELPIWVYLNLGNVLSEKGQVEAAISAYQKALALEPENAGIQQLLEAAVARKDGRKDDIGRAQQLQREGSLDEALAEYQAVLAQDSNNLAALHQVALICESQGKWNEAIEGYRKAIEVDENPPFWIYRHLGFTLSQQGNLDEAIEAYEKAIELTLEENNDSTYSLLGEVQSRQGNVTGAIESYQKAIDLNPNKSSLFYLRLGQLFLKEDRLSEAINLCKKAVDLYPHECHLYHFLGDIQTKKGENQDAIQSYEVVIKSKENHDFAIYQKIGDILIKEKKFEEAKENYKKIISQNPKLAYLKLGNIEEKNNNLNQAINYYRLLIEIDVDNSDARKSLQRALVKQKEAEAMTEKSMLNIELNYQKSKLDMHKEEITFNWEKWVTRNSFFKTVWLAIKDPNIKVVSFDCFDTFVYRDVIVPTCAFYMIGERLRKYKILASDIDGQRFHDLRILAESSAREKLMLSHEESPEVKLEEIYAEFPNYFFGQHTASEASKIELEVESSIINVYEPVLQLAILAQQLGKDVVITSDTYLSSENLRQILKSKTNFDFRDIFTSSDNRTGKGGDLFSIVLKKLDISPNQMLHIGDNYNVDIYKPIQLGIQTGFLPNGTSEIWQNVNAEIQCGSGEILDYIHPDLGDIGLTSMRSKILSMGETENNSYWAYGATILGPIFYGFSHWILDLQSRLSLHTSIFLMREGEFLSRLLANSAQVESFKDKQVYVSRRVVRQADIWTIDEACLRSFITGRNAPSILEFLNLLGLDSTDLGKYEYLTESSMLQNGVSDKIVELILSNSKLQEKILNQSKLKRFGLLAHLRSVLPKEAFDPHREENYRVGVIDIGWNGSIQKYLTNILQKEGYKIEFFGFYLMTTATANTLAMNGLKVYGFLADSGRPIQDQAWVMRTLEILEQSCTPPIGSLIDYDLQGNPITSHCLTSPDQLAQISSIQQGVLDFCSLNKLHFDKISITSLYKQSLYQILFRSVCRPSRDEVNLFSTWSHDENMVQQSTETLISGDFTKFISHMTPRQFLEVPMSELYWPYAVATTQAPQTAALLRAISSGVIEKSEIEAKIFGLSTLYIDSGTGFSQDHSISTEIYRNIEGNTYIKLEFTQEEIQSLCFEPIDIPSILKIHWIVLTYWCDYSNMVSRVTLNGSQIGSLTKLRNMRPIGTSTYQTSGNPQIEFDFSKLNINSVRKVKIEAGISLLLVDTPATKLE